MQIIVRDDSPELNPETGVEYAGDGLVRAEVDDARIEEFTHFVKSSRAVFLAGDGRKQYGHGFARDVTEAESFLIGQLSYLETKAFNRWYQPKRYTEVLAGCIDNSAGPWAKSVIYQVNDQVGQGKRIAPSETTLPEVGVSKALVNVPVELGGLCYSYTVEDLLTSAYLGTPLPESKQAAAIEGYQRHMNIVALQGEENFKGLYNFTGVTAANRTSGAVWDAATGDTIVNDIIAAFAAFGSGTGGNAKPRKIVFPFSTRQLLYKPRSSTATDMSIEKYIASTLNVEITDDIALETLGAGATKRVVFVDPNLDNMVFHIPRAIQFLAPQMEMTKVVVPATYKYGGFEVRRVQTVRYMDGV